MILKSILCPIVIKLVSLLNQFCLSLVKDPRRERPPAVYGHFVNVPTHFNVKLPLISGHLPNADADSNLLVAAPAITDSANKCHVFGGHFNQKSVARTRTCHRQFAQISVLSSGDQRAIHHVIESDEPRDCGKSTTSLVTFVLRHHVGKVMYSVCSTRDVEEQNDS